MFLYQSPTTNIEKSKDFYKKLGFDFKQTPYGLIAYDQSVSLILTNDRKARLGFRIYDVSDALIDVLSKVVYLTRDHQDNYLFSDAGIFYYLERKRFEGVDLTTDCTSILGNFAGGSIESVNPQKTLSIWKTLGCTITMGDITKGWVALTNPLGQGISIMAPNACPHSFANPSLTYFNGQNNLDIIGKVRAKGINIFEEITVFNDKGDVDNVILRDPSGLGFFVFSD